MMTLFAGGQEFTLRVAPRGHSQLSLLSHQIVSVLMYSSPVDVILFYFLEKLSFFHSVILKRNHRH